MSEQATRLVLEHAREGAQLRERFFAANAEMLVSIARVMAVNLAKGGKILFCGNGGSAADAQHLAAEFVNRFLMERPPLPAIALTTDTSVLTAIGNDYSFDQTFSKQVQALAKSEDVLVAMSTSGNSPNMVEALKSAHDKGTITVGLLGKDGGDMMALCDFVLHVEDQNTPLIQEVHITAGHMLCRLVDYFLFEAVNELEPFL